MKFKTKPILLYILCALLVGCDRAPEDIVQPEALSTDMTELRVPALASGKLLVIMIDGLRTDALSTDREGESVAPNLAWLADEGVYFTQARSSSSLHVQSVASVFSGRLPSLGGTIGLYEAEPHDGEPNLARSFDQEGYYTGIISNQAAIGSFGFTRYFDEIRMATPERKQSAADLVNQSLEFVIDAGSDPYFLYVHFGLSLPSTPDAESYYHAISEVDAAVGKLIVALNSDVTGDIPLVIVTAPNGFELGEHGGIGSGWTLNEEVLRVPLILYAPNRMPAARIDTPVSLQQLAPTLLTIFNLENPFTNTESLFEREEEDLVFVPPVAPHIAELVVPERVIMRSVTDGRWKYTVATRYTMPENRKALALAHAATALSYRDGSGQPPPLWGSSAYEAVFDLANDPLERSNRVSDSLEAVAHLRETLATYQIRCMHYGIAPRMSTQIVEETPEENVEALESVGYL